jgi:hypothetical protein
MIDLRKFFHVNGRWIVFVIIVILIFSILLYFVKNIEEDDQDLLVDEVIIGSVNMDDLESDLKISVHMTNKGKSEVEDVKLRAFVIERDSNLARDEASLDMDSIPGKTTEEGELFISVPNNDSYRIELLVFEDSKLTLRGSGTIDLTGVGVASEYRAETGSDTNVIDDLTGSPFLGSPESADSAALFSVCLLIALPTVVIMIIVFAVVKRQKKKDEKEEMSGAEASRKTETSLERSSRAEPLSISKENREKEDVDEWDDELKKGPFE